MTTIDIADLGDTQKTISKNGISDGDYLAGWINPAGETPTILPLGIYNLSIYLEKTGGNKDIQIYWRLVERKSDNSETVLATSSYSDIIGTDKQQYIVPLILDEDIIPASGSRIVGKVYAHVTGTGNDPSLTIYYEDNSMTRWAMPTTLEVISNQFVDVSGDTMTGPLILSGDPTSSLEAATKQYVDSNSGSSEARLKVQSQRYSIPGWTVYTTSTTAYPTYTGTTFYIPIYVIGSRSFDRMSVNVYSAGDSDNPIRLGIYNSRTVDDYILPGTVKLDAGLVDVSSTGEKYATIDVTLDEGYYFIAISITTGEVKGLTLRAVGTASRIPVDGHSNSAGSSTLYVCYKTQGYDHQELYENGYTDNPPLSTFMGKIRDATVWLRYVAD